MIASTSLVALEQLREPAAPVARDPGDQDAAAHVIRARRSGGPASISNSSSWMRARTSSATVCTRPLVVPRLVAPLVGRDRLQETDAELGRQVGEPAEQAEQRERRRDREIDQAGELPGEPEVAEDRHRLLGPDDGDGHDRRARAHRGLDEAAAAEAPQPVAVLVELLGALAALGEDEHQLLLVVEQPVHVGGMRGHAADLGDEHGQPRIPLEEVLDRQMQRPRTRVLGLDRLGDHRRVRRERAGVIGDQQRAAGGWDVLDALDLDPEPVVVEELVERLVDHGLDALGAPQSVTWRSGSTAGQVRAVRRAARAAASPGDPGSVAHRRARSRLAGRCGERRPSPGR